MISLLLKETYESVEDKKRFTDSLIELLVSNGLISKEDLDELEKELNSFYKEVSILDPSDSKALYSTMNNIIKNYPRFSFLSKEVISRSL